MLIPRSNAELMGLEHISSGGKMLIPSCFHGLIKDVKKENAKVARKTLEEAVAAY